MGRYRRTVSFPNPIPSFNSAPKSYHVRSVSLPCGRTHPLIPQLRDEITELRTWVGEAGDVNTNRACSTRLVHGMSRLKSVLDSLDDVLQLPQTQDSLSTRTDVVERLLEDFLRFVDVYEVFHSSMLGLKQELSLAQIGLRRKDGFNLGPYVKAHKKTVCEVGKLISTVGSLGERSNNIIKPSTNIISNDFHDEIASVVYDVHQAIASVSEAVFGTMSGSFEPGRKPSWAGLGLGLRKSRKEEEGVEEFMKVIEGVDKLIELKKKRKNNNNHSESCFGVIGITKTELLETDNGNNEEVKMGVLKKMKEMEECVEEMEKSSERVFRSLISNRVSLLNILTHA